MKKIICFMLILATLFSVTACSKLVALKESAPQVAQMRSICELATMQCYFHNVAKYSEDDLPRFLFFGSSYRKFWVEYSGIVTIGLDASLVTMKIDGDTITITIPPAKVTGCKVDESTLTKDSFIVAQGSADVKAEHQTEAFKEAQAQMREAAENDTILLANAQQRAQKLLEDYVNNIGNSLGKTYKIEWVYVEDSANTDAAEAPAEG